MADLPEILETVVLQPGDRLVIVLPALTTPEQADHMRHELDRLGWAPDQVLMVAGVEQLAVLKAEMAP